MNYSETSYAQQNASMPLVNYTKLFSESKEFETCVQPPSSSGSLCLQPVNVRYEDMSTVVLSSRDFDLLWKAVAEVKEAGYKIDAVTTYPIPSTVGNAVDILVVMSR